MERKITKTVSAILIPEKANKVDIHPSKRQKFDRYRIVESGRADQPGAATKIFNLVGVLYLNKNVDFKKIELIVQD